MWVCAIFHFPFWHVTTWAWIFFCKGKCLGSSQSCTVTRLEALTTFPASSITEPRPLRVRGWAGLSEAQLGRWANWAAGWAGTVCRAIPPSGHSWLDWTTGYDANYRCTRHKDIMQKSLQILCKKYVHQITTWHQYVSYDQQDILFPGWVGGQQKYAPARGRESRRAEEEKGTVRTVLCLLGSCLPLGWTLRFRLRLEWPWLRMPSAYLMRNSVWHTSLNQTTLPCSLSSLLLHLYSTSFLQLATVASFVMAVKAKARLDIFFLV